VAGQAAVGHLLRPLPGLAGPRAAKGAQIIVKRTALVTGANRGIGLAIASGLVDAGLEVIIAARDPASGAEAARSLGARHVQLDVRDPDSITAAVAACGDVDVLVNNAGVLRPGRLLDNPTGFAESLAVMVEGPYLLIAALAPGMVRRDYGRIVNVSSGWGSFTQGIGGPSGYGVAKAALNALTVAVAQELPPTVLVNAMCPGWVRTRMGGAGAPRSPEQGADTALWLSTLPDGGPSGGFFRHRRPIPW
jgi:NAD(P)-dependent dehydrogenase (short-subunit alcohol dehydrogenase family)